MVKLAISALVVAQLCILQAQASHYIQWKLARGHPWIHKAGICIHNGYGMVVSDMDLFGSGVKNYGYHQNGYSVNVNWDNENVGVDSWDTPFKMAKLAISALVVAQLCLLQAQASHYIEFKLIKDSAFAHRAGICIHNGDTMLMTDMDNFGSGVKNYGFHQNGFSANVNWNNENVGVDGWGTYWFQEKTDKNKKYIRWKVPSLTVLLY
ncbi:hypothetical protein BGX33_011613 [Mortierella sp. NVP41]|nr:hypothetical protein BGX33_011613 [Mortierella sp. NVP41]